MDSEALLQLSALYNNLIEEVQMTLRPVKPYPAGREAVLIPGGECSDVNGCPLRNSIDSRRGPPYNDHLARLNPLPASMTTVRDDPD